MTIKVFLLLLLNVGSLQSSRSTQFPPKTDTPKPGFDFPLVFHFITSCSAIWTLDILPACLQAHTHTHTHTHPLPL